MKTADSHPDDPAGVGHQANASPEGRQELEPILVEWYRRRLERISEVGEFSSNAHDLQMQAVLMEALDRRGRPPEESRRWLANAHRSRAAREVRAASTLRSSLFRSGRRMIRPFVGHEPYRHGRTSQAAKTRVLHAVADLQIGGAQQLVVDLAASTPNEFSPHIVARSVALRFRPGVAYTEDQW
ncbi:MAG: hypothetical protein GY871_13135, partial [Actinomycetales bacterium]|nr:hypothetical protein [Actinomycetales bacterium]